jgi:hypothetical protein
MRIVLFPLPYVIAWCLGIIRNSKKRAACSLEGTLDSDPLKCNWSEGLIRKAEEEIIIMKIRNKDGSAA